MKIALFSPPWTDALGLYAALARKRVHLPSLGILYLAATAELKGHTVTIIDADADGLTAAALGKRILEEGFDLVGITATTPIFHKAVEIASQLKHDGFIGPIVIGGEHLNIFRKDAFSDCFDYAFAGESEQSFGQFLDLLEQVSDDWQSVAGLIYRKSGVVFANDEATRRDDLDSLPFPSMHLLKNYRYVMTFAGFRPRPALPILASRGCPFKCSFCSEPLTNPRIRFRSAKNIADEIEKWHRELKISHFYFVDSNLTLNREQIEGFCNEVLARRLPITFEGWTRANLVDRKILALMKQAGLIRISYGIESGSPEILKIIHKEVSREDMLEAFRITAELGIEPACFVMLGLPGETRETAEQTIRFVSGIPQILYSNLSIVNPYPGTELYKWASEGRYGMRLLTDDFSKYQRYGYSPIAVNDLGPNDLIRLQKIGLFRIHFTPRRILAALRMMGLSTMIPVVLSFCLEALKTLRRKISA